MPTTFEATGTLLLAIVPGFIAIGAWSRSKTWAGPAGDLLTILRSLAVSVIVQVVAAPATLRWIYPHRTALGSHASAVVWWLLLVVLLIPILGGLFAGWLTGWAEDRGLALAQRVPPSVWDWLFSKRPPYGRFIVIEFNDGRRVGGVYAQGSVAFTSPEEQGIYLCPEWELSEDGELHEERVGSGGLMVTRLGDVRWLRVLDPGE
jgi:hypothetical protein